MCDGEHLCEATERKASVTHDVGAGKWPEGQKAQTWILPTARTTVVCAVSMLRADCVLW